jgi:hypothetical protein
MAQVPEGAKRLSQLATIWASAVCNIVADALLIAFVIPQIARLQMSRRQKMSVIVIVGFGRLFITAAIARLDRIIKVNGSLDETCPSSPSRNITPKLNASVAWNRDSIRSHNFVIRGN